MTYRVLNTFGQSVGGTVKQKLTDVAYLVEMGEGEFVVVHEPRCAWR